MPKIPSCILSQFLWCYKHIQVDNCSCFQWLQIISSMPNNWKQLIVIQSDCNENYLLIPKHHLIRGSRNLTSEKLTSKKKYDTLVFKAVNKASSNLHFEELFKLLLSLEQSYCIPHITIYNT